MYTARFPSACAFKTPSLHKNDFPLPALPEINEYPIFITGDCHKIVQPAINIINKQPEGGARGWAAPKYSFSSLKALCGRG
jgi:hypothetical protein